MGAIASFTGIKSSNETLIQTFSSGLRVAPEGIRSDNLLLDVPSIGTLTGDGTIGANKSLNFKMRLKVSTSAGGVMGAVGGLTSVASANGIPFTVSGDTTNPVFKPALGDELKGLKGNLLGGGAKGVKEQQQQVKDVFGGFLGKKKPDA